MTRRLVLLACLIAMANCGPKAAAPVVNPTPPPTVFEQKMRWILQLEDQRQLRGGGGDLLTLLTDQEARIRRRSALAAGRVKLPEAIPALTTTLQSEADPEVRQMAAFAMGLIGDAAAAPALMNALADPDPLLQGRAAEALGMIAHKAAAQPIGAMIAAHITSNVLGGINPDDMGYPKASGVEAVRLGIFALVRLGSYDALAAVLVDQNGRPRSRWWPVAFAFQRINDPRAATVLLDLFNGEGQLTRAAWARRRIRVGRGPFSRPPKTRQYRLRSASRRCVPLLCSATPALVPSCGASSLLRRSIKTSSWRRSSRFLDYAIRRRSSC